MTIVFVTGNARKVGEARLACDAYGIEIEQKALDIKEIQSNKPQEISEHKAREAFEVIEKPLVVTDTFFHIPALNGFPGPYMKYVAEWFTPQDFIHLMADKKDKRIMFSENITYVDKNETKFFSKEFWGVIVDTPRGKGNSIEDVAEFEGHTLGERRAQGGFSHKAEDYVWIDFATWFKAKSHNVDKTQ